MNFWDSLIRKISISILIPQTDKTRERWVGNKLKKLKKGIKILDAGAGESYYSKYCKHLHYVSQDFAQYDGKGDAMGIQTGKRDSSKLDIISDITDIPVRSGSFDAVLCVEVLEHLPRPLEALKELSRVLKKGGVLILTAPTYSHTHYSPYYYYSGFATNFYKHNFPLYDFNIEEIYIYGNYFDSIALELARLPLVCFRSMGFLSLPLVALCTLGIPIFIYLRILSIIKPEVRDLLNFGHCIKARKS